MLKPIYFIAGVTGLFISKKIMPVNRILQFFVLFCLSKKGTKKGQGTVWLGHDKHFPGDRFMSGYHHDNTTIINELRVSCLSTVLWKRMGFPCTWLWLLMDDLVV